MASPCRAAIEPQLGQVRPEALQTCDTVREVQRGYDALPGYRARDLLIHRQAEFVRKGDDLLLDLCHRLFLGLVLGFDFVQHGTQLGGTSWCSLPYKARFRLGWHILWHIDCCVDGRRHHVRGDEALHAVA